ncbi:aldo/keto reductase [Thermasporomyces composti]|jgi:aryl-alcohol dehydrogenase-like predicted oxidoreductase|uniref:Aryl-alcohol dehydrogenase-like predicted oxidoreductase n=1 Tax=Thermasporomyces composti TaxID=696763 RepID=A0A3D9VJE8_THECX|nr:aldo/keto reductase [Thermasporomyces composti]REF38334.1 aryl-alcohol dehydrogenase-like predicted oxidoreductase [Thermasporomyces composti]
MEQRYLGRTGLRVSRLGLGTMTWGRDTDEHEARDQLTAFVEAGGTLIDTSADYADGDSERLLGRLIGTLVRRDEVVLATKAGVCSHMGGVDVSRRTLLDQLDASLDRLGVDSVDLWQVSAWSNDVPVEETLAAMDFAVSSGRARYVGLCNYSGWQTGFAAAYQAAWPGRAPIASTQVEYSLVERGIEREVLPAARALGLGVLAWSPLGRGVLTGKYRTGTPADSRAASPHFERFVGVHLDPASRRIVDAVCRAADGLGLSPIEVALAWVRDRPGVTAPIVGARTAAQLRGSLTVEEVELPVEITAALDDVSALPMGYPERWEPTF